MRIGLAGLCTYENYGDQLIGETVEYLVKRTDEKIDTRFISFEREKKGLNYVVCAGLLKIIRCIPACNFKYKLQYAVYKLRMKKFYMKKLEGVSKLIFACGSFKYGTQNLWAMYSILIDCCAKKQIPVMFDAMNIQKYKGKDWRCQTLKKHANMDNVKMITTRDGEPGVQRLKEFYMVNPSVKTYGVGDPAFWTADLFGITKKESDVIGINLIRSDAFLNYGGHTSKEKLNEAYAALIASLEKANCRWELFTNGMKEDLYDLDLILEKAGVSRDKAVLHVPSSARELTEIISNYKCILGARLHACIISYSLEIPCVGFYWDEKLKYFAQEAQSENMFCSEEEFSGQALFEKLIKADQFQYNLAVKDEWKKATETTIKEFINEE